MTRTIAILIAVIAIALGAYLYLSPGAPEATPTAEAPAEDSGAAAETAPADSADAAGTETDGATDGTAAQ
ncbi:MAG: hypothetical protein AAFR47_18680 [Pseudomonadota bacterium]